MAATAVPLRSRRAARRRSLLRVGDERLVARVRAGDDDAFEAIYDRYYRSLLAFCRHMLGSRDAAEDALQHSFASAYTAMRGGDGVIDLRPWLYAIARNRCLSALRAQRDEVPADDVDLRPRALDGLAGEIQMRADLRDLVDDLQRLPDDQRAAIVLFELGDQSHEQIADVLGVRREKVKALVFQAREALLRARRARAEPCAEVRERLATLTGDVPRRSMLRGHIDRCPGCAAFEREVRRQRAAFAAIMPVAPTVGLKASVLAIFGGGGAAAVGGGGGATVAGSVAAGGTTVGLASLGAKGVVTKVMAVVALAGGGSQAAQVATDKAPPSHAPGNQRTAEPAAASAAAATLRAPARKFSASPTAHLRGAHKHSSHSAAEHAPAVAPVSASPSTTPAPPPPPAATHTAAPASEAPAATPQPSQQEAPPVTSTTTTPPLPSTETPQAPAATEPPAAPVAPAPPQDPAPTPPAAAPATVPPATAPATVAPETTVATTTVSAPADAAPATTGTAATDAAS
jgi:RNA polymerase sigma factor (sigma-70 family)